MENNELNLSRRAFLFGRKIALDEEGSTAIEYGLIAGLISIAVIASVNALGFNTSERFRCIAKKLKGQRVYNACKRVGIK